MLFCGFLIPILVFAKYRKLKSNWQSIYYTTNTCTGYLLLPADDEGLIIITGGEIRSKSVGGGTVLRTWGRWKSDHSSTYTQVHLLIDSSVCAAFPLNLTIAAVLERVDPSVGIKCREFGARGSVFAAEQEDDPAAAINAVVSSAPFTSSAAQLPPPGHEQP